MDHLKKFQDPNNEIHLIVEFSRLSPMFTSTNTHNMTTTYKVGILIPKPVAFLAYLSFSPSGSLKVTLITKSSFFTEAHSILEWPTSITLEIEALLKNGIRELVECPQGSKPIGCKLMFRVKLN